MKNTINQGDIIIAKNIYEKKFGLYLIISKDNSNDGYPLKSILGLKISKCHGIEYLTPIKIKNKLFVINPYDIYIMDKSSIQIKNKIMSIKDEYTFKFILNILMERFQLETMNDKNKTNSISFDEIIKIIKPILLNKENSQPKIKFDLEKYDINDLKDIIFNYCVYGPEQFIKMHNIQKDEIKDFILTVNNEINNRND